jgi:hypothetical protein
MPVSRARPPQHAPQLFQVMTRAQSFNEVIDSRGERQPHGLGQRLPTAQAHGLVFTQKVLYRARVRCMSPPKKPVVIWWHEQFLRFLWHVRE